MNRQFMPQVQFPGEEDMIQRPFTLGSSRYAGENRGVRVTISQAERLLILCIRDKVGDHFIVFIPLLLLQFRISSMARQCLFLLLLLLLLLLKQPPIILFVDYLTVRDDPVLLLFIRRIQQLTVRKALVLLLRRLRRLGRAFRGIHQRIFWSKRNNRSL
ncbi:hypothetical protein EYF80_041299 [Liparis tanakae]|uniref:Uncharacterized protein n=1 Tax=Liparis tanakae TaxID=230148 RepID=A0A4Z2G5J4_9TELE|nr:hypothetical protein EYF80_041299 [Liparis tanakae]